MAEAKWLKFLWMPERQEIAVDGEVFAHPVATNTSPSHDVAHLLAAASGLPWKPRGTRDEICVAEFDAILLEYLLGGVLEAVLLGRGSPNAAVHRALENARWFVAEHYAPFPMPFDQALTAFATNVDAAVIVRLSPIFFRLRVRELEDPDFHVATFHAAFASTFAPEVDAISREAKSELAGTLSTFMEAPEAQFSETRRGQAALVCSRASESV